MTNVQLMDSTAHMAVGNQLKLKGSRGHFMCSAACLLQLSQYASPPSEPSPPHACTHPIDTIDLWLYSILYRRASAVH